MAFLLEELNRVAGLVEALENQFRTEASGLRAELARATAELREHTALAVREVAERSYGCDSWAVSFVIVGIGLAYAANLA